MGPGSASLWTAARRAFLTLFGSVDGAHAWLAPGALLEISGGPTADFNTAIIDSGAGDAVLSEFLDRVKALGLPAAFMFSSASAPRLNPMATELGLAEAGNAPLMALTVTSAAAVQPADFAATRVIDAEGLAQVTDLVADAFEQDRRWVARTFCAPALLDSHAFEFFLASKDGLPYSTVTTSVEGTTVGIWSMATPKNRQRQGAGRAALLAAIEHHRRLGATTFYLIATPAGKPLYESVGFRTVEEFPIWVYLPRTT
jgi:GNAT superfamily N-acetyltransferase